MCERTTFSELPGRRYDPLMAERNQLPPQIKRIELKKRAGGRPVVRYQLTVDTGVDAAGHRKQLRKRYATEREARGALARIRGEVARGVYVHPSEVTIEQACTDWLLSRHGIKRTTKSGYEDALSPVRSELGHVAVQKLTRRDVDALVARLRAGTVLRPNGKPRRKWSPRYCNLMLGTLSQVLDQLVKDGSLVRNVVEHVDRVPGNPAKFQTYTEDQVSTLLASIADDRDRHAWHLGLCGLRRGEIGGLRWDSIDLKAKTITIGRTRVSVGGEAVDQDDAKSEESARTLPLPEPLWNELKAAKKRQTVERLALGPSYRDLGNVVCNEAGEAYHPDTLTKMWTKAIAAAGVPHIRLQDARHTCATIMHLQGVPTALISAWLGHADLAFTMRTYVHSQPDALATAAQTLAQVVTTRDNLTIRSGSDPSP